MIRHKFHAKPTECDGIKFASKAEARFYGDLKLRQMAGEVLFFLRQVPIHLPGNVRYVLDFMVFEATGDVRCIDVKGCITPMYLLKKKQVEAIYPITIEEVKC